MNLSQIFSIKVFVPLMVVVMWMASCLDQSSTQPTPNPVLRQGDQIEGMVLTTGVAGAPPLWIFCSPLQQNEYVATTNCNIPAISSKIAIGHFPNIASEVPVKLNGSEFTWELLADGQPAVHRVHRLATSEFVLVSKKGIRNG